MMEQVASDMLVTLYNQLNPMLTTIQGEMSAYDSNLVPVLGASSIPTTLDPIKTWLLGSYPGIDNRPPSDLPALTVWAYTENNDDEQGSYSQVSADVYVQAWLIGSDPVRANRQVWRTIEAIKRVFADDDHIDLGISNAPVRVEVLDPFTLFDPSRADQILGYLQTGRVYYRAGGIE